MRKAGGDGYEYAHMTALYFVGKAYNTNDKDKSYNNVLAPSQVKTLQTGVITLQAPTLDEQWTKEEVRAANKLYYTFSWTQTTDGTKPDTTEQKYTIELYGVQADGKQETIRLASGVDLADRVKFDNAGRYTLELCVDDDLAEGSKSWKKAEEAGLTVMTTAEAAKGLYYTLDEQYDLANGDTVTVTVHSNRDDFSDCIEKYGAIPATTEKTYTVEGLNEYVTDSDGLTDSVLVSLQNQAQDVLNAYIAKSWDSECVTLKGMSYLGYYILTPKNKDNYGVSQDVIILPYQVTSHNHFEDDKGQVYDADVSYYWYIAFRNVSKDADGNIAGGLDDYYTANASFDVKTGLDDGWWEKYWSYDGYQTLDELYSNAVTRNVEDYNHQDNVG